MNHNIVKLSATIADKQSGMLSVSDKMQSVQEQLVDQCREAMNITSQASEVFKNLPNNDVNLNAETAPIGNVMPKNDPRNDIAVKPQPIAYREARRVSHTAPSDSHADSHTNSLATTITTPEKGLPPRKPEQHQMREEISPPAHKADDMKYRNFMNSARNLIEDLHKTSVELSRNLLDKSEFKKIESDYKKGKRNAFTLHLLSRNNHDFTNHVSGENLRNIQTKQLLETYQNKFESLMHSSKEFSPDNSLATDFSLSDIGKLYTMLAKIVGRNSNPNGNLGTGNIIHNTMQMNGASIN